MTIIQDLCVLHNTVSEKPLRPGILQKSSCRKAEESNVKSCERIHGLCSRPKDVGDDKGVGFITRGSYQ